MYEYEYMEVNKVTRIGCVWGVQALSRQLVKVIGGISGPCKTRWYKNRQRSVSLWGHISDKLSVVSVRAKPHKGTERVRSSAT